MCHLFKEEMVALGVGGQKTKLRNEELLSRKNMSRDVGTTGKTSELVAATVYKVKQMLKCVAEERPNLAFCSAEGGFRENRLICKALKKGQSG